MVPVRMKGRNVLAFLDTGGPKPRLSPSFAAGTDLKVSDQGIGQEDLTVEYGAVSQKLQDIYVILVAGDHEFTAGQELFSQAVVEFDLDKGLVTLVRPGAFKPPTDKPVSVQFPRYWPTTQIKVNGHDICAIVDTGFSGGVALSQKTMDALALPSIPGRELRAVGEGGREQVIPEMAPLKELRVGERIYQDVSVVLSPVNGENRCTALLGMEILSKHRLIFDLGNRRMWLLPRHP
jgi:hypothetical protein